MFKLHTLSDFLTTSNAGSTSIPCPIHSTSASNLYDIVSSNKLLAVECNVFNHEKLCYLFVGRPAYKWSNNGQASWWQCPIVFVLRSFSKLPIKRIYPFDSGAFAARRLPEYITIFTMDDYLLGNDPEQIGRIIKTFYGSTDQYLSGENRSESKINEEVLLTPRHMKISALLKLYNERSLTVIDDRARTVEVQVAGDINIDDDALLGMVLPESFKTDNELVDHLSRKGYMCEYYPLFPISVNQYFGSIYEAVNRILSTADLR
jgi:hypothetical protein